jgi:hypothetical protein
MIGMFLLVLALVCFLLATWKPTAPFWNQLIAVGLAALTLSMLLLRTLP